MNNKFLYSAIGDNTPENREHLEKIGYKDISRHCTGKYIETTTSGGYSIFSNDLVLSISSKNYTDNSALFRAVTAMRDDSDYMQWYKTDFDNKLIPDVKEMYLCRSREFMGITTIYKGEEFKIGTAAFHKATLEELINHFNSK